VEAHCAADRKKVEAEASAMRDVLKAAQADLDRDKAHRLREQSNVAAGLEHMKVCAHQIVFRRLPIFFYYSSSKFINLKLDFILDVALK
jgi:hypothetical protein